MKYQRFAAPPGPPPPPPGNCGIPTSQSGVKTKYGDYTSCIQQNIHQTKWAARRCLVSSNALPAGFFNPL